MKERIIHEDESNAKRERRREIIVIIIVAALILFAIFGSLIVDIFHHSTDPVEEESSYSTSDSKHKVAVMFIDGHMVEYEYSWAIAYTSNGTINIKFTDGTEIETFIGNVYLFEYDTNECASLNELRDKFK